ncbi:acVLRF1 family peptidyl-tRNA hydrolase [Salinifilum aidingensis]
MAKVRELPGGGRAVEVGPERVARWFERFAERHGGAQRTERSAERVTVTAADGSTAAVAVPFGPLPGPHGAVTGLNVSALVEHLHRERRIGLVLVRRGAHSVGIAAGERVVRSSTDRHRVQGRTKAGGWSQQRYARRRAGQAREALRSAADAVAEILVPELPVLDGVVLGGDRGALDELAADGRLAELFARAEPRVLDVAEPRRAVLDEAARRAAAVEVEVREA